MADVRSRPAAMRQDAFLLLLGRTTRRGYGQGHDRRPAVWAPAATMPAVDSGRDATRRCVFFLLNSPSETAVSAAFYSYSCTNVRGLAPVTTAPSSAPTDQLSNYCHISVELKSSASTTMAPRRVSSALAMMSPS